MRERRIVHEGRERQPKRSIDSEPKDRLRTCNECGFETRKFYVYIAHNCETKEAMKAPF